MKDYESFKNYIKEKSGVDVIIFGDEAEVTDSNGKITAKSLSDGFFRDKASGKTYFTVRLNGKTQVAAVEGATETEQKLAGLIKEIADNFSIKEGCSKAEFFVGLLRGDFSSAQIKRLAVKFKIPETSVSVIIIQVAKTDYSAAFDVAVNYGDNDSDEVVKLSDGEFALVKFSDDKNEEYRSQGEYAEYLVRTIYEETGINVNAYVGGKVSTLGELPTSFIQARTAQSFSKSAEPNGSVHSYKEYVLLGMIQDLPKHRLNEYYDILEAGGAKEIFSDEVMLSTAEEFFNNSLNASETARALFLHRNTLNYRLDKIEKATGLNIRKFSDAVTFRLITYLNDLIK